MFHYLADLFEQVAEGTGATYVRSAENVVLASRDGIVLTGYVANGQYVVRADTFGETVRTSRSASIHDTLAAVEARLGV
jgi:hypothetical protein